MDNLSKLTQNFPCWQPQHGHWISLATQTVNGVNVGPKAKFHLRLITPNCNRG